MMVNPWMILGSISVAVAAYFYGHHVGYVLKDTEDQLVIAQKNAEMNHQKEQQDVKDEATKQEFETKLSSVLASRPRLFVNTTTKGGCSTTASVNGQERAELDGQTVEDLIRLVAEGDRAIIELNSCIDRYEAVRSTLSGNR
jgi:allophanate hydrolase subunit 2